jgi:hypothetical protein
MSEPAAAALQDVGRDTGTGEPFAYAHRVEAVADLADIFAPEIQICVLARTPDPRIVASLQSAAARGFNGLRRVVGSADAAQALELPGLDEDGAPLARDIAALTGLYIDLLGCPAVGLRLEALDRAMCPGWHYDRTGIRLLCTYRGPGTEWLDDAGIDRGRLRNLQAMPASGQASAFDIVLLKGALWQGNDGRGAIHRSPAPRDGIRYLLALDALWDDAAAAPPSDR